MAQHTIKVTFTPKPLSQRLSLNKIKSAMENGNGFVVFQNPKFEIAESLLISFRAVGSSGTKCTLTVEIDEKTQNYKGTFDSEGFADISDFIDLPLINGKDKSIPFPPENNEENNP
jgi:hypothetical protein